MGSQATRLGLKRRGAIFTSSAVVRGGLEIRERFDAEVMVEPIGELPADAGDRSEQLGGFALATEPFEHREATSGHQIANRPRDARSDAGQRLQSLNSLAFENVGDRLL